ncbi:MAG: hypothetical protein M0Z47_05280 [Actinomycetota bacterium]|nr:hypothetical protein [Actinomycetota bacterium]
MSGRSSGSAIQSRLNERLARILNQDKSSDASMVAVLGVALVLGLIGFAVYVFWVGAIVVLALGLGFSLASRRWDRIELANPRAGEGEAFTGQSAAPSVGIEIRESGGKS